MSNINLYQDEVGEKKVKAGLFDRGLVIGAVIFVIVLAGYGALGMYLRSLDQKISAFKAEEELGRKALNRESVNSVASFQQRLEAMEAGKKVFTKNDPAGVFRLVQDTIIKGVVASEISFQEKELKVSFVADNFEILAKQILSFKKNDAFQNIQVKNSSMGTKEDGPGKVSAELDMSLSQPSL